MERRKEITFNFLASILALALISIIFWFTNLDMLIQSLFYQEGVGWYLKDNLLADFLYEYGPLPSFVFFIAGLIIFFLSFFGQKKSKRQRKIAVFMILLLIIGPGLIVNFLLKDHLGRPRPRDLVEFGGEYEFVHHWLYGNSGKNSSFPSGHASVAFYLLFPYFILKKSHNKVRYALLGLGLCYGFLMGWARMIQGAHFFSDVIWAGGITYLTGLALYYILKLDLGSENGE